jgi:hypothetical protein
MRGRADVMSIRVTQMNSPIIGPSSYLSGAAELGTAVPLLLRIVCTHRIVLEDSAGFQGVATFSSDQGLMRDARVLTTLMPASWR